MNPKQMQEKLLSIEAKLDQILAQPALPPEVNLTQLTEMLMGIFTNTTEILARVSPVPDYQAQAESALASLQQLQAQLLQQANSIPTTN